MGGYIYRNFVVIELLNGVIGNYNIDIVRNVIKKFWIFVIY